MQKKATTEAAIRKVLEKFGVTEIGLTNELQLLRITQQQFVSFSIMIKYITYVYATYYSHLVLTN